MQRVVLLFHDDDPIETRPYLILALAERWRARGIEVTINRGPGAREAGDVAILHVDRTIVPPAYAALARRYRRTVNARALDIGKRRIASARVTHGDNYDGPVIVKTNLNCFGLPEREGRERAMPRLLRSAMRRVAPAIARLPWWISGNVGSASYPVFATKRMVPASIWFDPRFVVQRYAPERASDGFVVRRWHFFGEAGVNFACYGTTPFSMLHDSISRRDEIGPPPPAVTAIRREFGLDYGKIDYVVSEGEVVIFDVNKTAGVLGGTPYHRRLVDGLAPGLTAFFEPAARADA